MLYERISIIALAYTFNRLDSIPKWKCDGQTYGQTELLEQCRSVCDKNQWF